MVTDSGITVGKEQRLEETDKCVGVGRRNWEIHEVKDLLQWGHLSK